MPNPRIAPRSDATQPFSFDELDAIREQFPVLRERVNGRPLVYLDNAASAQKPWRMIEETTRFLSHDFANVHRGVHTLSGRATDQFEVVREKVRIVLNASSTDEIIFTKGCTEGINLVAQCWAVPKLQPGDEILVTEMEHHSNLVPWHLAAKQTGAIVRGVPVTDRGELDLQAFAELLSEKTKILAVVHVSNAIGTVNPVKQMIAQAKKYGALCLVDGAQAGPHLAIDVQDLGADFYTLSCHKMYAPTGVGVLFGRLELLRSMPPYQGGGSMIREVSVDGSTYAEPPAKFEPGTPNIVGVVGYGASLDFLASLCGVPGPWGRSEWAAAMNRVAAHEAAVLAAATNRLSGIEGIRIIGTAPDKAAILCLDVAGAHPHDVGQVLDSVGIAVRTGHHCCQPLMKRFGLPATTRASFGLYNTIEEADFLAKETLSIREMFQ